MASNPIESTRSTGIAPGRALSREEIFGLVQEKLDQVATRYAAGLGSNVEIVSAMGSYISNGGGKRLRPALLLLSSGLCDYRGKDDVVFGAVFEFIHTATLIHDDIIDGATIRRGRESVNHRWGNQLTVLMGDHLYLTAMQLAIEAGNLEILDLLAKITLRMIEGEMIQRHQVGVLDLDEAEHLEIVERKTASLFSGCCRVPAMLAAQSADRQTALASYGLDLGMAFQLVDDLLDLTADEKVLGKPTASDLRDGKLTLPLIHLLESAAPGDVEMVRAVMQDGGFESVSRAALLSRLEERGSLARARAAAAAYANRARAHLIAFPDSVYRDALLSIPDFVLARDR